MWRRTSLVTLIILVCSPAFAQQWTAPQRGWLYVLDAGGGRPGGNILLINPFEGTVKGVLSTSYHPNFGMCPDGSRLYVTDGPQSTGFLSVFETKSEQLLEKVPFQDRAVYTVRPASAGIGCSSDGRWVFIQTMKTLAFGKDQHSLSVMDARSGQLSSGSVPLPVCGIAQFIPWPFSGWDMVAECSFTNSLSFVSLDVAGNLDRIQDVPLTWASRYAADGSFTANGQRATTSAIVDPNHRTVEVFRAAGGVDQLSVDALTLQAKIADGWKRFVPPGGIAISPNSGLVYVGFMPYSQRTESAGLMNGISVMRTVDITEVASIQTTLPFSSLAISGDGQILYTVNTGARSITAIDTATMKETKTITNVGEEPSLVLVHRSILR